DLLRRRQPGRLAQQIPQGELIEAHAPVELLLDHLGRRRAEGEVDRAPGAEQHFQQAHAVRRAAGAGHGDDEVGGCHRFGRPYERGAWPSRRSAGSPGGAAPGGPSAGVPSRWSRCRGFAIIVLFGWMILVVMLSRVLVTCPTSFGISLGSPVTTGLRRKR